MSARLARRGMSLIEIMVALTLMVAVFAITLPFLRAQTAAIGRGAGRMDAEQIARYAILTIDRDLRRANADSAQPLLVLAHGRALVFTANLVANADNAADVDAFDLADDGELSPFPSTVAPVTSRAVTLPLVGGTYPTSNPIDRYGNPSGGETISYWLEADATVPGRSDVYVLWRRVNAGAAVEVVRGLVVPANADFFTYLQSVTTVANGITTRRLDPLPVPNPVTNLPYYRWADTEINAVRAVEMVATGRYVDPKATGEVLSTVRWTTTLVNAPGRLLVDCGPAPVAPGAPSVAGGKAKRNDVSANAKNEANGKNNAPQGALEVQVQWQRSADDSPTGDVRSYFLEWRDVGTTTWRGLATIPARTQAQYFYLHGVSALVGRGLGNVQYRVRAIDCGGTASAASESGAIVVLP